MKIQKVSLLNASPTVLLVIAPCTVPNYRQVDTHVYHIRPRLKRRPLPLADYPGAGQSKSLGVELALSQQGVDGEVPDFSSGSSPRQWHERAMAREVRWAIIE